MKRIISLILTVAVLLCLCACNDSQKQPQVGFVGDGNQSTTDPCSVRQEEVVATFGITMKNSRIVASRSSQEGYTEFVVVRYNENGEKTGELSYFFCLSEQSFDKMVEENKDNPAVQVYEYERYLTIPTNHASKGIYDEDVKVLEKDYILRGKSFSGG